MNALEEFNRVNRYHYRAYFNNQDLGGMSGEPKITFESFLDRYDVYDTSGGEDQLEFHVHRTAGVTLRLYDVERALLLAGGGAAQRRGVLLLRPQAPGSGKTLQFTNAELLPEIEFYPEADSNQSVKVTFRVLPSGSDKKLVTIA